MSALAYLPGYDFEETHFKQKNRKMRTEMKIAG
jgi:hypothetical protein